MPYIEPSRRVALRGYFEIEKAQSVGELNYVITQLCRDFLFRSKMSYADLNGIIGVLESAKLEFYRRAVSPYEDDKARQNGDVY